MDKDGTNDLFIKIVLPEGGILRVETSKCQFQCCGNAQPTEPKSHTTELKSSTRGKIASPLTKQTLISDFSDTNLKLSADIAEIKQVLSELKTSNNIVGADLITVKTTTNETNELVKKITENKTASVNQMDMNGINLLSTPNNFAFSGLRKASAFKRKLNDDANADNPSPKISSNLLPKAKEGTRDINIGPTPTYTRPNGGINIKPLLEKSIWVSGLDPSVSSETMVDFIINNTDVKNKDDFKCFKLVKKDFDVSKLSYISFKIDIKAEFFDYLVNPNLWPKHVSVREFIKAQPVKLDQFVNKSSDDHIGKQRKLDDQKNQEDQTSEGMEQ